MNELQSFTPRNEEIVLKTTRRGVLTFLFALVIKFEHISIIPVLRRFRDNLISRVRINAHTVFRTMRGGDLTHG